jgi:hypothetical protein
MTVSVELIDVGGLCPAEADAFGEGERDAD